MSPSITNPLQSLRSVRERCHEILEKGLAQKLLHFDVYIERLHLASDLIIELISRDYGSVDPSSIHETLLKIPPHGRWRHFGDDKIQHLISKKQSSPYSSDYNVTKMLLDLFVVAVLLDAGAGDLWKYKDDVTGETFSRSEGLAVASLRMFESGKFSSSPSDPLRVDSVGLKNLTLMDFEAAFQVSTSNPLLGITGRLELLTKLSQTLELQKEYFSMEKDGSYRPGSLLKYLLANLTSDGQVDVNIIWELVVIGLGGIWPETRTKLEGEALGDTWMCEALENTLVPFHKLSQWLTYSIIEPITRTMRLEVSQVSEMTGLAEYRNGGLFIDLQIIKLKDSALSRGLSDARNAQKSGYTGIESLESELVPLFKAEDQVIVEWRALTVALIDCLAEQLRARLHVDEKEWPLAKVLEAGTWKAGREIAKKLRPRSAGPPIATISDGTLF